MKRLNPCAAAALIAAASLAGCGLPYVGSRLITPERRISVASSDGNPLTGYDLTVYRCSNPGSRFDRAFSFPAHPKSEFLLPRKSKIAVKRLGAGRVAPDFYAPYEPEPYWVVCVSKPGFRSRRWSIDDSQGDPVKVVLSPGSEPGPDDCAVSAGECTPCRSYEYFLYHVMRYRHQACDSKP